MAKRKAQPGDKRITAKRVQANERRPVVPTVSVKPEVDDDPCNEFGITLRQMAFCEALAGPAGGNKTRAAEMAGYASDNRDALKVTASRQLTNANVYAYYQRCLAKRRESPEWAKSRLYELASSTMQAFMSIGPDGQPVYDWEKAEAAGALGTIKEFTADVLPGGEDGKAQVIRCKLKVHDSTAAVTTLLKMHGLLKDSVDITSGGKPIKGYVGVTPDDWDTPAAEGGGDVHPAPLAN